jgi:hypothetical protein
MYGTDAQKGSRGRYAGYNDSDEGNGSKAPGRSLCGDYSSDDGPL